VNQTAEQCWRVFCAIALPQHVCELVLRQVARLREATPGARASWARASNLHLTIKFLGDIPLSSVSDLSAAVGRAAANLPHFSIRLERSGVFPERGPAKVLWLGVNEVSGTLVRLHTALEDECAIAGFARESRPFHPHLTLARVRHPQHARVLAAAHKNLKFDSAEFDVRELLVIRSELSSEGSKYSLISRHAFGVR
jgi:2'-5' RNA ligase